MIEFKINLYGFDVLVDGNRIGLIKDNVLGEAVLWDFDFSNFYLESNELKTIFDKLDELNEGRT